MWKRNAACLRSCSSVLPGRRDAIGLPHNLFRRAVHIHHGGTRFEGPISDLEFTKVMHQLLPSNYSKQPGIALAISGGVDSMAVAALSARCRDLLDLPALHAFVVDHQVRPESADEARWVAEELSNLGLKPNIIPLEWPKGKGLGANTTFEADARELRLRALGAACASRGITSLLMGHHEDDQAETILMRLKDGRFRSGIAAMKPVDWLAECHGLYGAHHSGSRPLDDDPISLLFEHGGVKTLRPMLGFGKKRLIATCEKYGIPWAEDRTNFDRTYTARNAIRYIVKHHRLPDALSKDSLIAAGKNMRSRLDEHEAAAESLFNASFLQFDFQTASLVVRFPPLNALFAKPSSVPSPSEKVYARNTAQYLLRRVTEIVSPRKELNPDSLATLVLQVYPDLAPEVIDRTDLTNNTTFTNNGCLWINCSEQDSTTHHTNDWLIYRQAPKRALVGEEALSFPQSATWSDWKLFDGRYWFRILNIDTGRPVVLRMLGLKQVQRLLSLRNMVNENLEREIEMGAILENIKPSTMRQQIPALFLWQFDGADGKLELLALPTLQSAPKGSVKTGYAGGCTWEIRYKKVDTGTRHLSEIVREPVWHTPIGHIERERQLVETQLDLLLAGMNMQNTAFHKIPRLTKKVPGWIDHRETVRGRIRASFEESETQSAKALETNPKLKSDMETNEQTQEHLYMTIPPKTAAKKRSLGWGG